MLIAIREDNKRRINEMIKCISGKREFHFENRADNFINYLANNINSIDCLSLDHDLENENIHDTDPGDGRDVVKWLCENKIQIPVIIHTSNSIMGDSMYYNLAENKSPLERIDPYNDLEWIGKSWIMKALNLCK